MRALGGKETLAVEEYFQQEDAWQTLLTALFLLRSLYAESQVYLINPSVFRLH